MDITKVWEELAWKQDTKIIYLVLDGVGDLPDPEKGGTALQIANTPNLDQLAQESSCGLLELVGPAITPGSGPGHLSLFGYDPLQYRIGRGVLSALGIDFDLKEGDVAARVNFATMENGKITDRRAGRISTELNEKLCQKIRDNIKLPFDVEYFFETVSEHRALFVLRGKNLEGDLKDTDPQTTDIEPNGIQAKTDKALKTADIVGNFIQQVKQLLAQEQPANMILMRGFEKYSPLPALAYRFGIRGVCIADYPMYRGLSRLLGMDVTPPPGGLQNRFNTLEKYYHDKEKDYDFYFIHVKKTDSTGEDGNFEAKVAVLEEVDALIPKITQLQPDVLVVTADHSTPALMHAHSWHPVPVLLRSRYARVDEVSRFDEYSCQQGSLGLRPGTHIMGLALANAQRLRKFGA